MVGGSSDILGPPGMFSSFLPLGIDEGGMGGCVDGWSIHPLDPTAR